MARGRDTDTFRLDRAALRDVCDGSTDPDAMREILFEYPRALSLGRISLIDITELWASRGCILWQPTRTKERHVTVRIHGEAERIMIHVCRVVWAATRAVIPGQGVDYYEPLRGDEELHHACRNNGAKTTAFGACLNPGCLRRGNAATRQELRVAYKILEAAGMTPKEARP